MYIWVYTGEVNAKRIRERYLKAVLRQDIQYFDKVGAGEVATRIQTDTRELPSSSQPCHTSVSTDYPQNRSNLLLHAHPSDLVQQGISEKVALVVHFLGAFLCGFILAFSRSWRLAFALSTILPCIGITGALMNKARFKYIQYVGSSLRTLSTSQFI